MKILSQLFLIQFLPSTYANFYVGNLNFVVF